MSQSEETKSQLKSLRDKLAFEVPRAKTWPSAPTEITRRLNDVLERVSGAYVMCGPLGSTPAAALEELCEDALVEGHVALNAWGEWLEKQKRPRARAVSPTADRRVEARTETNIRVKLLRHVVQNGERAASLTTDTADLPARNVSLGGIFVNADRATLPAVDTGSVIHIAVTARGDARSFSLRGVVIRRDDTGVALRWIADAPADQKIVAGLLEVIRRTASGSSVPAPI